MRAHQIASTQPYGPTYVCLDVALQEQAIEGEVKFPGRRAVHAGPAAGAGRRSGRASGAAAGRRQEARHPDGPRVAQRSRLAGAHRSRRGARRRRAHRHEDVGRLPDRASAASGRAALPPLARGRRHPQAGGRDPVARLDRPEGPVPPDIRPERSRCRRRSSTARSTATSTTAGAWTTTACRRPTCRSWRRPTCWCRRCSRRCASGAAPMRRRRRNGRRARPPALPAPQNERTMTLRDLALVIREFKKDRTVTIPTYSLGWPAETASFNHPLDYLGFDSGGGVGSGPGNCDRRCARAQGLRPARARVIGDGDYAMASSAFWTAAHMEIPMLVVVANNRSYYNDVAHQERMAVVRNRPVANKFIGQEMIEPDLDIVAHRERPRHRRRRPGRARGRSRGRAQARRGRGARRQDLPDRRARRRPHPGRRPRRAHQGTAEVTATLSIEPEPEEAHVTSRHRQSRQRRPGAAPSRSRERRSRSSATPSRTAYPRAKASSR